MTNVPTNNSVRDVARPNSSALAAVDTHKVQAGDSLVSLAQNYYGSAKYAKFLQESNPGVSDPVRLSPGMIVKIPPLPQDIEARIAKDSTVKNSVKPEMASAKTAAGAAGSKRQYKVKSGDSLYKIAKDQLGDANRWKEILALNKTALKDDPTLIQVGQNLSLPE